MKIGTRSSQMAMAQTRHAASLLAPAIAPQQVDIVAFKPQGDRDQTSKLLPHGGKGGAFVQEIRDAIRDGSLNAAMHSLKDMPGDEEAPGLTIGAYLPRDPVEDVMVLRDDCTLKDFTQRGGAGKCIGTNSVRRAAFLRQLFPQAQVIHFRGAVDTRLAKLDERRPQKLPDGGETPPADALVLAHAGMIRLGLTDRIDHIFSVDEMLPAVGQGIVALECARTDFTTRAQLTAIDDPQARCSAIAERAMLWVLNGHCNTPIAGIAMLDGDELALHGAVLSTKNDTMIKVSLRGPVDRPKELGRNVGLSLLERGAGQLIAAQHPDVT